ncbi:MAG TPA: hypothetical protein VNN72_15500 [Polyangiaceae bacterium]|nr:hypothetical protein [Polyangiaceae bacterium]
MTLPISDPSKESVEPPRSVEALWHAITTGSFRIVNWYDHEGRRYLVAEPVAPEHRVAPTARQRKALALRSAGCALKVIASELGVSLTTASREVEIGLELLGLDSTAALAAVLGHAA